MKKQIALLFYLLIFSSVTYSQNISGKWVGKLLQSPGGLATEYYFEMTLKQKDNIISGTSFIAMGDDKSITGLMSFRGTFDGTFFYYEDIKVLNQEGLNDISDWCIKKCKFKLSKSGDDYELSGHWTGTSRFGYCSPGTVSVGKKITEKAKQDFIVKGGGDSKVEEKSQLVKVNVITKDDENNTIASNLEMGKKGKGSQKSRSTGKYTFELDQGNYHLIAKETGYYDYSHNFSVVSGDTEKDIICILKKIRKGDSFEIENLQFERSKANITKSSAETLDKLVEFMHANPAVKIRINGHTDSVGSKYLNRLLSFNRANAVVAYLVRKGIEQDRLTAKGFGPDQPIADNATIEGRAKNRRVEFEIMGL